MKKGGGDTFVKIFIYLICYFYFLLSLRALYGKREMDCRLPSENTFVKIKRQKTGNESKKS